MNVQLPMVWNMGWIEVILREYVSGKTEELIRRLKRAQIAKQKVQVFKPRLDDRYSSEHVTSHSSLTLDATNIDDPEQFSLCWTTIRESWGSTRRSFYPRLSLKYSPLSESWPTRGGCWSRSRLPWASVWFDAYVNVGGRVCE